MDIKQITFATLAGAVTLFALGFLIYGLLGGGSMIYNGPGAESALRKEMLFGAIGLTEVITALLISVIYIRWAHIRTFVTGATHGLWIGALLALIVTLDYYSSSEMTSISGILFYTATHAVRTAVAGGVIGWVLGKMNEGK